MTDKSASASSTRTSSTPILSFSKQQAVDEAFNELFFGSVTTTNTTNTTTNNTRCNNQKSKKKTPITASIRSIQKKKRILADIFGNSCAMKLMSTTSRIHKFNNSNSNRNTNYDINSFSIRKKKIITEKKVFAGQTVEVQRSILEESKTTKPNYGNKVSIDNNGRHQVQNDIGVNATEVISNDGCIECDNEPSMNATSDTKSIEETTTIDKTLKSNQISKITTTATEPLSLSSTTTTSPATATTTTTIEPTITKSSTINHPKNGGIDAVLQKIAGQQKITTMDKTNYDWENFKDKHNLEDELKKKAQSNDAYLVKKDFLDRVDLRQFEQEKEERNRKRSSAANGHK